MLPYYFNYNSHYCYHCYFTKDFLVHWLIRHGKFQTRTIGFPHLTTPSPIIVMLSIALAQPGFKPMRLESHDLSNGMLRLLFF